MIADTKARRRRSGLDYGTAQPDWSATVRHRDDRDQAPFPISPMIADTKARRRRSGLGSDTAEPDCSAIERHRDDRDQAPFRECPTIAMQRLGVGVAALVPIQLSQIGQRCCDPGMIATKRLFPYRQ